MKCAFLGKKSCGEDPLEGSLFCKDHQPESGGKVYQRDYSDTTHEQRHHDADHDYMKQDKKDRDGDDGWGRIG